MSKRLPVAPSAAPLERYAQQFDPLFSKRNQRDGFRRYIEGLLMPIARNKTLSALADQQPVTGTHQARAQRLQWFLSESRWDADVINQQRLGLLIHDPISAPHRGGVLVIEETGERKEGTKIAYAGQQYLNRISKVDNGVVSFTSLWADEDVFYPIAFEPFTPAHHFPRGSADPDFRTKPELACLVVEQAIAAEIPFCAVVADCFYGEHDDLKTRLDTLNVAYVLALQPCHAWQNPIDDLGVLSQMDRQTGRYAQAVANEWMPVPRKFRDGHVETWWALEVINDRYGPDKSLSAVVVTKNRVELPSQSTWFLITNLRAQSHTHSHASVDLEEIVRLYGLHTWASKSYKEIKSALGWSQYQVRSAVAIRRHWQLICCAFSFYWWYHSHREAEVAGPLR